jgi:hypothetical protein
LLNLQGRSVARACDDGKTGQATPDQGPARYFAYRDPEDLMKPAKDRV